MFLSWRLLPTSLPTDYLVGVCEGLNAESEVPLHGREFRPRILETRSTGCYIAHEYYELITLTSNDQPPKKDEN